MISAPLLEQLQQRIGEVEVGELLQQLGRNLGGSEVPPPPSTSGNEVALALAQRLDALGYEAHPARHGDEWQIEAFNCVFHALAQKFPRVCTFVLAYVESATQRRLHHLECLVRGGQMCRFRIGETIKHDSE